MKRILFFFLFLILSQQSCVSVRGKNIFISGSDTMVGLVQALAERFNQKYPGINVIVSGGGSSIGIAALLEKRTDIAAASRKMDKEEFKLAEEKYKFQPKEIIVAYDGICVVVNPKNPLTEISLEDLKRIFTGKIKDWGEIKGSKIKGKIVVITRESTSGTYKYFQKKVLRGENYSSFALISPSTHAICMEIAKNKKAIGYIGLGYLSDKTKALALPENKGLSVLPTLDNILLKRYPLSRPLYFYTRGTPTNTIASFISFVLSKEGQAIVAEQGFVPLPNRKN
jgi:phosphate transport system substrate-binding protein